MTASSSCYDSTSLHFGGTSPRGRSRGGSTVGCCGIIGVCSSDATCQERLWFSNAYDATISLVTGHECFSEREDFDITPVKTVTGMFINTTFISFYHQCMVRIGSQQASAIVVLKAGVDNEPLSPLILSCFQSCLRYCVRH